VRNGINDSFTFQQNFEKRSLHLIQNFTIRANEK